MKGAINKLLCGRKFATAIQNEILQASEINVNTTYLQHFYHANEKNNEVKNSGIYSQKGVKSNLYIIENVPLQVKDIYLCLLKMDSQVL